MLKKSIIINSQKFTPSTSSIFTQDDLMTEYYFNNTTRIAIQDDEIWDICVQNGKDQYYEVEYRIYKDKQHKRNVALFEWNDKLHLISFDKNQWIEEILQKN